MKTVDKHEDELNQLDIEIGRLRGEAPKVEYWAMDREEHGIFITFDNLRDANMWMGSDWGEKQAERYGAHIVRKEIWKRYTRDIAIAWQLVDEMNMSGQGLTDLNRVAGYDPADYGSLRWVLIFRVLSSFRVGDVYIHGVAEEAPEAISRGYRAWRVWQKALATEDAKPHE